jgi:hypothetical protein
MRARLLAVVLTVACGRRVLAPPPAASPEPPSAGVTVTLRWDGPVDLDLYVTDPVLETVYYGNPRSASGGVLEADARCARRTPGMQEERVRWTKPPSGRYRVGVDFPEACGARVDDVAWAMTVDVDGRRQETTGRAHLAERRPAVLEFDVGGRR